MYCIALFSWFKFWFYQYWSRDWLEEHLQYDLFSVERDVKSELGQSKIPDFCEKLYNLVPADIFLFCLICSTMPLFFLLFILFSWIYQLSWYSLAVHTCLIQFLAIARPLSLLLSIVSRSVKLLLRGSRLWPTDRQTRPPRIETSVAVACIYALIACRGANVKHDLVSFWQSD